MVIVRRQIGKFQIKDIDNHMREAKLVLARVIVVRAEMIYYACSIEYTAISEDFDAIDEGDLVPWYVAHLRYDGMGGVTFDKWTRET